jgi:drug/metabolite transporter (DMT)-like permease
MTYYISAILAIVGTVGYHNLVKKISPTIDPVVSIISIYLGVLILGVIMMPFFYSSQKIMDSVHQLGWVQFGIAICIMVMELGFILMYRSGWDLSAGNIVTGVFINLMLLVIGVAILHEHLNIVNIFGVFVCIAGVTMIEYHSKAVPISHAENAPIETIISPHSVVLKVTDVSSEVGIPDGHPNHYPAPVKIVQ